MLTFLLVFHFMSANDIAMHPSKHKIVIREQSFSKTRVRRTQSFLIRAPNASSVVWPGCFVEYDVPADIEPDSVLAIEPHDASQTENWPNPQIAECVTGKIRIINYTQEPQFIQRNKHLCRARLMCCSEESPVIADDIYEINKIVPETKTHARLIFLPM